MPGCVTSESVIKLIKALGSIWSGKKRWDFIPCAED